MATMGTTTLKFGAIGSVINSTGSLVGGQTGILTTSMVEAWLRLEGTSEHPLDDLVTDPIRVTTGAVTASVGFTIYGTMPNGPAYGSYLIDWVWV